MPLSHILCLSLISFQGTEMAHVPEHIRKLSEARILNQMYRVLPDYKVAFENNECPNKIQYYYDSQNIIITGDNSVWSGRMQASLTELLDGRRLALENYVRTNNTMTTTSMPPKKNNHWIPWILSTAAIAITTGAILAIQKNKSQNNRPAENPLPTKSNNPTNTETHVPVPINF